MAEITKLLEICKDHNIFIQTHDYPDADAIAAAFGLQYIFKYNNINSKICYSGEIDRLNLQRFVKLIGIDALSEKEAKALMTEDDYLIYIDCQREGGNVTAISDNDVGCIDHHQIYNENEYQFVEITKCGACASLIARYMKELDIRPDENVATALLFGMKVDTKQFSRGVTGIDIEMFAFLHQYINEAKMKILENANLELSDLKAFCSAIENIKLYADCGFTVVPENCPDALIATLCDFMLSLDEIGFVVIFCLRHNGIKLSVRSIIDFIDAGKITHNVLYEIGNGGGHSYMAGGFIARDKEERDGDIGIIEETTKKFMKEIGNAVRGLL